MADTDDAATATETTTGTAMSSVSTDCSSDASNAVTDTTTTAATAAPAAAAAAGAAAAAAAPRTVAAAAAAAAAASPDATATGSGDSAKEEGDGDGGGGGGAVKLGGKGQWQNHGKWKYFLSSQPPEVRAQLWLDKEASYSVTEERCANAMTQLLQLFIVDDSVTQIKAPASGGGSSDRDGDAKTGGGNGGNQGPQRRRPRVLDATACVGGNSFSLQASFDTIACEFDAVRFRMLEHNLRVLGAPVGDPERLKYVTIVRVHHTHHMMRNHVATITARSTNNNPPRPRPTKNTTTQKHSD